ncbi:MAG TPA: hypothetical protein VFE58_08500, partial [Tepidisphaeraceae bacterium]|nr:hypothetical protein [Tepidisphaeraceae bacterium]
MMMKLIGWTVAVVVFVGGWARGEDYAVRDLKEGEVVAVERGMVVDACRYAEKEWKVAKFDAGAGYWGDGVSDGNQGIRAIGEMVLGCGTLVKYREDLSDEEWKKLRGRMVAGIRYVTETHLTGTQKCTDGKKWGGSWQSAMWAGEMGMGAWLGWGELDDGLKKDVERVMASEADRFLAGRPPGGVWGDTKAEENGWNLTCLVLAENMFPNNPHAGAWREKGMEYMMNTLSTPGDLTDGTVVEGRAVKDWVTGANIHSDFTLENHGIFHPSYVACSSYFLTQAAMYYKYAGKEVPGTAEHHLMDTWGMFKGIILGSGEPIYPQGMDWELHGLSVVNLFASLGTWKKDALAARLEGREIQSLRTWQNWAGGDLMVPGSRLGFTRHACEVEQVDYAYLAHQIFGKEAEPMGAGEAEKEVEGVRDYGDVGVTLQRTASKLVSVSWKNRVMGQVVPISGSDRENPFFTVPMVGGLFGSMQVAGAKGKDTVVEHSSRVNANGFETEGELLIG